MNAVTLQTPRRSAVSSARAACEPIRVFARGQPHALATGGDGCFIEDASGQLFLDMTGASEAVPLGRQASSFSDAVRGFRGPAHLPAPFRSKAELDLARTLAERSFAERVFFCTSAADAVEHAIRFARSYGGHKRRKIVSFDGGYHGATLGALAASDRPEDHLRYGPVPGLHRAARWGSDADLAIIDAFTSAVILEPIQAAGGVRVAPTEWLEALRARCREVGALLIFDESATGIGRTGQLWTYQALGVAPDILCTGSLAGGLPFHGVLLGRRLGRSLRGAQADAAPATSPLLSEIGRAVLTRVADPAFLAEVARKADWLERRLHRLRIPRPFEVRGVGLQVGVRTLAPSRRVAEAAFEQQLIVNAVSDRVIQLMPALTVTQAELEHALELLERAIVASAPRS